MNAELEIIFEELPGQDGDIGLITLNRPKVLNALNHRMFLALDKQLTEWADAPHIKAVVIRAAEGRAFCAGGDIRHAYELAKAQDPTLPAFFADEYKMNRKIYHFPKPYIALLDGITMGGGAGISVHGSHRVATEKLIFSMPETGIGFFPDIGASYFLSRLKHKMGFYLGLTGARINCADCYSLGIVNHVVGADSLGEIISTLVATSLQKNPDRIVTEILNRFGVTVEKSELMSHLPEIEMCFGKKTVEDIFQALEHYPSAWCELVLNSLETKSPTSLKVTLREIQEGEKLSFDECMKMEFRLTNRFLASHDFFEGIRAAIIDKDQSPRWQPSKREEVKAVMVENFFAPLEKELS